MLITVSKMNLVRISVAFFAINCLECIVSVVGDESDDYTDILLPECCGEGQYLFDESTCGTAEDEFNTTFRCSLGSYILDPALDPADEYRIVDGNKLYLNYTDSKLEPDSYCIGVMPGDNRTINEVVMLCYLEPKLQPSMLIKGILALISVLFICATLYVYKIIPQLRETQDKATIFCISCLAVAFTALGIAQTVPGNLFNIHICKMIAVVIYAFLLAYLAWLNTVIANVLKVVVFPQWKIKEKRWYQLNHVYGWTIPIALTIILLVCQHVKLDVHPGIGDESCWILSSSQWLYLYVPFTILLTLNLLQFVIIAIKLFKYPGQNLSSSKKKAHKYKCQLYFKLFILSGMTWFFELFSHIFRHLENYWFITDAVNALHGVLIFLVLIIFRKRVRRELAGKRICWCFVIPQHWKKIDNTEDDGMSDETKYDNIQIRSQSDNDESRS